MSIIVVFILVAVLGVIVGATFALVRTRSRRDATSLEPGPGAAGVPPEVKEDVARHVAELQVEAEEEVTEVDAELAAAVDEAMAPPVEAPERPRFRDRLGKARSTLSGYLTSIGARGRIDDETWDELEEALIRADVGMAATTELLDVLRARVKAEEHHRARRAARRAQGGAQGPPGRLRPRAAPGRHRLAVGVAVRGRERRRQDHHHRQARQARRRATAARW